MITVHRFSISKQSFCYYFAIALQSLHHSYPSFTSSKSFNPTHRALVSLELQSKPTSLEDDLTAIEQKSKSLENDVFSNVALSALLFRVEKKKLLTDALKS
jgi:hypothetical protein